MTIFMIKDSLYGEAYERTDGPTWFVSIFWNNEFVKTLFKTKILIKQSSYTKY